jgi:hypothetical protein
VDSSGNLSQPSQAPAPSSSGSSASSSSPAVSGGS